MNSPASEIEFHLGEYTSLVDSALDELAAKNILPRIWQGDHTVWSPDPTEISNRLAWLHSPQEMTGKLGEINDFVQEVKRDGFTHALLLGMGGSSLAPELFARTFSSPSALRLAVLDSTDPGAVLAFQESLDPARTLFIVSTKSGTTEETLDFFKYFYNWVSASGVDRPGRHFAAITDPGSKLVALAEGLGFRKVFTNNPDIGGRYSALSFFGLAPAALSGVDLEALLARAADMAARCAADVDPRQNPAARLGAALGELAKIGRDKVTFLLPEGLASFGDWAEQLIAESTGKQGKGILPVAGETPGAPAVYGSDRLFVRFSLPGGDPAGAAVQALADSGFPSIRIHLSDLYDLGGQFFLWELATAIAGSRLGINPFDQPNVESAKQAARKMVAAYRQSGSLPSEAPVTSQDGISVFGPAVLRAEGDAWYLEGKSPQQALAAFLGQARPGDYIALQAFLQPGGETSAALQDLRRRLRDRYHLAVTAGFGPRFLHSTGQLHKGDAGRGLFVQFTHQPPRDAPIPLEAGKTDSAMTFGVLELAQALGDRQALLDAGRRVIRFHLTGGVPAAIRRLAAVFD